RPDQGRRGAFRVGGAPRSGQPLPNAPPNAGAGLDRRGRGRPRPTARAQDRGTGSRGPHGGAGATGAFTRSSEAGAGAGPLGLIHAQASPRADLLVAPPDVAARTASGRGSPGDRAYAARAGG